MVWWLFASKEDHTDLKNEVKQAFSGVKNDLKKASEWITHLNTRDQQHEQSVEELHDRLSSMEDEISEMRNFIAFFSTKMSKQVFKQRQTGVYKQAAVEGVQTGVQTAVQSSFLNNLSVMERAIVWTLLNTDLRLSCEDVAAILNKERSTIRGQINSIKQKSEGLIEEFMEKNGKKRFFIPEDVRETVFSKMRIDKSRRGRKTKK